MEDPILVMRAKKGDIGAFEELVQKYQSRMYYLCLSITKNAADAEDAAQNAFIKAFRAIGSFRMESAFSTWLYSIGRNSALDVVKKRKDHSDIDSELSLMSDVVEFDPEQSAVSREEAEKLRELINGLPDEFKNVLILREIEGMQYAQIAEALGISEGTVKSRISRARERLKAAVLKAGL